MTKDDVFKKLKELLVTEFELDPEAVKPESLLYTDLDLDSIDAVDMIVQMKEHVEGRIDPALFKNAQTVQDVVDVLYSLTHTQAL
jgi:acyl carrier protein